MMSKLGILVAGGIGYVLGARAGRERYDQIRGAAIKVKDNPTVQQNTARAAEAAKDAARDAAPVVKDKVANAASSAAASVRSTVGSSDDDDAASAAGGVPLEESAYPAPGTDQTRNGSSA
jgi:hypothetical protein